MWRYFLKKRQYYTTMLGRWDPKKRPAEVLMNNGYYW